jgi:cytochrome oxidase Cu insertion factor (SCO1/SenC/PrrC family)
MTAASDGAAAARRLRPLLLLLLLFFAPLLLSFALYYGWHWHPAGQVNHGRLLQPPGRLPDGATAAALRGKWSLVYVGAAECDAACRDTLYFMRQTHLGLGKDIGRVQRVLLATGDCCTGAPAVAEDQELRMIDVGGPAQAALRAQFPGGGGSSVFIVDPLGNVMMRYDARSNPRGLHDDLERLLALSHIG